MYKLIYMKMLTIYFPYFFRPPYINRFTRFYLLEIIDFWTRYSSLYHGFKYPIPLIFDKTSYQFEIMNLQTLNLKKIILQKKTIS